MSENSYKFTKDFKLKVVASYLKNGGDAVFGLKSQLARQFNMDRQTLRRMVENKELSKLAKQQFTEKLRGASSKVPPSCSGSSKGLAKKSNGKVVIKKKLRVGNGINRPKTMAKGEGTSLSNPTVAKKLKPIKSEEEEEGTVIELPEDPDYSILKRSISASTNGAASIAKLLIDGTQEVQNLLLRECDIVLECKVCRNLFRSMVNFLAHKRIYCVDSFCDAGEMFQNTNIQGMANPSSTVIVQPSSPVPSLQTAKTTVPSSAESLLTSRGTKRSNIDMIAKRLAGIKSGIPSVDGNLSTSSTNLGIGNCCTAGSLNSLNRMKTENLGHDSVANNCRVILEDVAEAKGLAVYQTFVALSEISLSGDASKKESTQNLVREVERHKVGLTVAINSDGKVVDSAPGDVKCMDGVQELQGGATKSEDVTCSHCNTRFATQKTLNVHLRTIHGLERTFFRCPVCQTEFVSVWGVLVHLQRAHNMSKSRAEKLRRRIHNRSFKRLVRPGDKLGVKANEEDDNGRHGDTKEDADIDDEESDSKEAEKIPDPELATKVVTNKCVCHNCSRRFLTIQGLRAHNRHACTPSSQIEISAVMKARLIEDSFSVSKYSCGKCCRKFDSIQGLRCHGRYGCVTTSARVEIPTPMAGPLSPRKTVETLVGSSPIIGEKKAGIQIRKDYNKISAVIVRNEEESDERTNKGKGEQQRRLQQEQNRMEGEDSMDALIRGFCNLDRLMCIPCQKLYTTKAPLVRHALVLHLNCTRYKCAVCGFAVYDKYLCVEHVASTHKIHDTAAVKHLVQNELHFGAKDLYPKEGDNTPFTSESSGASPDQGSAWESDVDDASGDMDEMIGNGKHLLPNTNILNHQVILPHHRCDTDDEKVELDNFVAEKIDPKLELQPATEDATYMALKECANNLSSSIEGKSTIVFEKTKYHDLPSAEAVLEKSGIVKEKLLIAKETNLAKKTSSSKSFKKSHDMTVKNLGAKVGNTLKKVSDDIEHKNHKDSIISRPNKDNKEELLLRESFDSVEPKLLILPEKAADEKKSGGNETKSVIDGKMPYDYVAMNETNKDFEKAGKVPTCSVKVSDTAIKARKTSTDVKESRVEKNRGTVSKSASFREGEITISEWDSTSVISKTAVSKAENSGVMKTSVENSVSKTFESVITLHMEKSHAPNIRGGQKQHFTLRKNEQKSLRSADKDEITLSQEKDKKNKQRVALEVTGISNDQQQKIPSLLSASENHKGLKDSSNLKRKRMSTSVSQEALVVDESTISKRGKNLEVSKKTVGPSSRKQSRGSTETNIVDTDKIASSPDDCLVVETKSVLCLASKTDLLSCMSANMDGDRPDKIRKCSSLVSVVAIESTDSAIAQETEMNIATNRRSPRSPKPAAKCMDIDSKVNLSNVQQPICFLDTADAGVKDKLKSSEIVKASKRVHGNLRISDQLGVAVTKRESVVYKIPKLGQVKYGDAHTNEVNVISKEKKIIIAHRNNLKAVMGNATVRVDSHQQENPNLVTKLVDDKCTIIATDSGNVMPFTLPNGYVDQTDETKNFLGGMNNVFVGDKVKISSTESKNKKKTIHERAVSCKTDMKGKTICRKGRGKRSRKFKKELLLVKVDSEQFMGDCEKTPKSIEKQTKELEKPTKMKTGVVRGKKIKPVNSSLDVNTTVDPVNLASSSRHGKRLKKMHKGEVMVQKSRQCSTDSTNGSAMQKKHANIDDNDTLSMLQDTTGDANNKTSTLKELNSHEFWNDNDDFELLTFKGFPSQEHHRSNSRLAYLQAASLTEAQKK